MLCIVAIADSTHVCHLSTTHATVGAKKKLLLRSGTMMLLRVTASFEIVT